MAENLPRTDWQEVVAGDENERFERHAAFIGGMQQQNKTEGATHRALHNKTVLGARAEFTVLPDLPAYARVGLFATPRTFPAWVRYSNGAAKPAHDKIGDVRGFSIKVVGVAGPKLIPGLEHAETQDFLMIQTPAFGFRNTEEFMTLVRAGAGSPLLLLPRLIRGLGFGRALSVLGSLRKNILKPVSTLAALRFWSPVPIKWGAYAVHYSARPAAPAEPPTSPDQGPAYLTEDLVARLRKGPLRYDFMIQAYQDEKRTPIEDASVEWLESDAPFVTVATLVIPQQDLASPEGQKERALVENFSFDPWHASEDFRPLGDVMRARGHAYRVSTMARKATSELDKTALTP